MTAARSRPMRPKNEATICEFVRTQIVSTAIGDPVRLESRPEDDRRSTEEVEELWASESWRFAIEHTLVEAFVGQIEDDAKFARLIEPVAAVLTGRLPGT